MMYFHLLNLFYGLAVNDVTATSIDFKEPLFIQGIKKENVKANLRKEITLNFTCLSNVRRELITELTQPINY